MEKGIEKFSTIVMPWLLVMIVGIGIFSLTLRHDGRTGLQGLGVYLIPDFSGTEGMASGPNLMFVSLPKVFQAMGPIGGIVGLVFFVMVAFAALTSCVSVMETLVAGAMEFFGAERKKVSLIIAVLSAVAAVLICLGYNVLYFELPLPNGQVGQLLDVMDYISNSFLMPLISLLTCLFIGWVVKPCWIAEEMELGGCRFGRKKLYGIMIRYIAPLIMAVLFVQSMGLLS